MPDSLHRTLAFICLASCILTVVLRRSDAFPLQQMHANHASVSLLRLNAGFGKKASVSASVPKPNVAATSSSAPTLQIVKSKSLDLARKAVQNHIPTVDMDFPRLRTVNADPPVLEVDGFFSEELCAEYIARAQDKGHMIASQTFGEAANAKRTSSTWYLRYEDVPELVYLVQKLTGVPMACFEEPQVVRYQPGQQFSWHYDSIPKTMQTSAGNRLATAIVYLNTVPTSAGGGTAFKDLQTCTQPEVGKALLFFPSFKDGSIDERTMHCGQVCMAEKWIAQIWIHEREYSPATPQGTSHAAGLAAIDRMLQAAKL